MSPASFQSPSVYFHTQPKGKSLLCAKSPARFPWLRIRSKHLAHNALQGRSLPASPHTLPSPFQAHWTHLNIGERVLTPGLCTGSSFHCNFLVPLQVLFAGSLLFSAILGRLLNTPTPLSWHPLMRRPALPPSHNCQLPENTQQPLCLLLQQEHLGPGLGAQ